MNLWARLEADLQCAVDALTEDGLIVPAHTFVAPGAEVAWDDCCEGQLWVRVVSMWPYGSFPNRDLSLNRCAPPLAVQVGMGILRCVTGLERLDDQVESYPTAAQLTGDARQMVCDSAALHRAITCCHGEELDEDLALDQWTPLGPTGGCYGGEWTYYIHPELECPEGSPGEGSV